jgi:phage terminase large subunit
MMRVEAARRMFPRIWFNAATTEGGREALGAYHERKDDNRNIGLGPNHDWSSHGADAFGLMCVVYEEPEAAARERRNRPVSAGGWMR